MQSMRSQQRAGFRYGAVAVLVACCLPFVAVSAPQQDSPRPLQEPSDLVPQPVQPEQQVPAVASSQPPSLPASPMIGSEPPAGTGAHFSAIACDPLAAAAYGARALENSIGRTGAGTRKSPADPEGGAGAAGKGGDRRSGSQGAARCIRRYKSWVWLFSRS